MRAAARVAQMGGSIVPHDPFFQPRISQIFTNGKRLRRTFCRLVLFVFIRSFVVQGHPSRMGGRRGLVIDEVAARGVVARRFSLGSSRRLTLQEVACGSAGCENGRIHRPRMTQTSAAMRGLVIDMDGHSQRHNDTERTSSCLDPFFSREAVRRGQAWAS